MSCPMCGTYRVNVDRGMKNFKCTNPSCQASWDLQTNLLNKIMIQLKEFLECVERLESVTETVFRGMRIVPIGDPALLGKILVLGSDGSNVLIKEVETKTSPIADKVTSEGPERDRDEGPRFPKEVKPL